MYQIVFTEDAKDDVKRLMKDAPKAIAKLGKLLKEMEIHPRTGTGKIEILKYYEEETWSRRITKKHRIVYRIEEEQVVVLVLSAYGHYSDN